MPVTGIKETTTPRLIITCTIINPNNHTISRALNSFSCFIANLKPNTNNIANNIKTKIPPTKPNSSTIIE